MRSTLAALLILVLVGCAPVAQGSPSAAPPSGASAAPSRTAATAPSPEPSSAGASQAAPDPSPQGSGLAGTTDTVCQNEDKACFEALLRDAIALADGFPDKVEVEEPESFQGGQRTSSWVAYLVDTTILVNKFWSSAFAAGRVPYRDMNYVIVDTGQPAQQSNCVDKNKQPSFLRAEDGPFYCVKGGSGFGRQFETGAIYVGVPGLVVDASKVNPQNYDFAVVAIVAHEFGHHVEHELFGRGWATPSTATWWELGADCLSGVFANNAYFGRAGKLTDTDVQEAMQILYNWGSDLPYDYSGDTHGSRQQRVDAFLVGYNNGNTSKCLSTAWPTGF